MVRLVEPTGSTRVLKPRCGASNGVKCMLGEDVTHWHALREFDPIKDRLGEVFLEYIK